MSGILLDTNIVLRYSEQQSPERPIILQAIRKLNAQGVRVVLAPQILVELWVVATRPVDVNGFGWSHQDAHVAVSDLRSRFTVLAESPELFQRWLDLVVDHGVLGKQAHDARIAAIALVHKIDRILTFNVSHFARFAGISPLNPTDIVNGP